jgi:hypothetical protein
LIRHRTTVVTSQNVQLRPVERCDVMRKVIDIYGRRRLSIYGIKRCYAIKNKMKLSHAFKPCDLTNFSMHLEPRWFDVYASGIVPPGIMH